VLALSLVVAALAIAGGCAKDRRAEIEELKAAIQSGGTRFSEAFARRDVTAIGQLYAADAQVFPPGMAPVEGRTAIQDMWKGILAMPVGRIEFVTIDVDGNGETAWETGRYTMVGSNGSTMDEGKYIVIWKREADGWKLYRDMWSSNSPQQGAAASSPATEPPAAAN
jgi:uncharacterized protein (TIGR02246 family)